jgi:UDP-N-acetylglucosamine 4,6-dehydratase
MPVTTGSAVLVTGGTGSFGREAIATLRASGCRLIRIYSRDEFKQSVLAAALGPEAPVELWLGDVRDPARLADAMHGIDFVLHAAALKQLPACEKNPSEALATNVLGTRNVATAARAAGVRAVIHLSADKAVYATSVYGATKFLGEQLVREANGLGDTRFVNLRYSNVLDSRGAVYEIFRERLQRGEAVKVLDPRMVRFFLSQAEVVDMALFALERCTGGETVVAWTKPLRIVDLAHAMQRVIGLGSVDVVEGAARPGEKLDAVLVSREESVRAVRVGSYVVVGAHARPTLEGATALPEQDFGVDDFEVMTPDEVDRLVAARLRQA